MQSSDPFEDPTSGPPPLPAQPPPQPLHPPSLREASVQQAVTFLNDPRVQSADRDQAVVFLRTKGVTDAELCEAFRRTSQPLPSLLTTSTTHHHPSYSYPQTHHPVHVIPPPHVAPIQPPPHLMQPPARPARPTWVSVFMGLTAAAGLYTAVREVLKHYVVPLYFPDAARIVEERRRREEHVLVSQERQIAELRERIQDLCASSERTTSRVEQLSKSLTSSVALREREVSQASELRDAIQQLSHSITASGGTGTDGMAGTAVGSRVGSMKFDGEGTKNISIRRDGVVIDGTEYMRRMYDSHGRKSGSLAYSRGERLEQDGNKVEDGDAGHGVTTQTDGPGDEGAGSEAQNGQTRDETGRPADDEDDEFMAMAPAQVDESWRTGVAELGQMSATRVSMKKASHPPVAASPASQRDAEGTGTIDHGRGDGEERHGTDGDVDKVQDAAAEDVVTSVATDERTSAGGMTSEVASDMDHDWSNAEQASSSAAVATSTTTSGMEMGTGTGTASDMVGLGTLTTDLMQTEMTDEVENDEMAANGSEMEDVRRVARQLFQTEALMEAQSVLAKTEVGESSVMPVTRKARPLSMPQMDTPLSDTDF